MSKDKIAKEELKKYIEKYMLEQNRPYNAQSIVSNLNKYQLRKTDCIQVLDGLVSEGVLVSKDYQTLRYYWLNQGFFSSFFFLRFTDLHLISSQREYLYVIGYPFRN